MPVWPSLYLFHLISDYHVRNNFDHWTKYHNVTVFVRWYVFVDIHLEKGRYVTLWRKPPLPRTDCGGLYCGNIDSLRFWYRHSFYDKLCQLYDEIYKTSCPTVFHTKCHQSSFIGNFHIFCHRKIYLSTCIYTEPKKKLSQNRTSRWAYLLRKKKKIDTYLKWNWNIKWN